MDRKELNKILENHKKWLETRYTDNVEGEQANLSFTDLSNMDLRGVDLKEANSYVADLNGANLRYASLHGADLRYTSLYGANLRYSDLSNADLRNVNLRYANLYGANLNGVDLSGADLCETNLINANLTNIKYDDNTTYIKMICPEKGSFIGYKRAKNKTIVELLIPKDALRSSATTNECRCSKAKVLSITNIDGTEYKEYYTYSIYNKNFIYKVGEVVEVKDFDIDRWNECSTGIHFFMTRDEAVNY